MAVVYCKTKGALVAAAANVTTFFFWQLISRKWKYEPIRQFKLSVLLCILCKCNCRRSISHCKSATQFAPQKWVSLITEKFPKEEGGQWPTSLTHFAKVTYLRPPTRLFHSPTLRRLGLCCDRSKSPEAETWNSLAHALTEFRIGKRILVDDLRSFRRRRSNNLWYNIRPWNKVSYLCIDCFIVSTGLCRWSGQIIC